MKHIFVFLLAILLSVTGLGTIWEIVLPFEPPALYKVGSVAVVSDGEEYEPYHQGTDAGGWSLRGRWSVEWGTTPLAELFDTLPDIPYADNLQVVVDGKDARYITYTLYDENLEPVVIDGSMLLGTEDVSIPEEPGVYILSILVCWGNPYLSDFYSVEQYLVKITRYHNISDNGKAWLRSSRGKKYGIHGIVQGMSREDVTVILGELPISTRIISDNVDYYYWDYENIVIHYWRSMHSSITTVYSITVLDGEYLGLTIGKSTKADADAIFGVFEYDYHGEAQTGGIPIALEGEHCMFSRYWERDLDNVNPVVTNGMSIRVYYVDDIVVCIEASIASHE